MSYNSQTSLQTADIGNHETVMMVDTYITETELHILCDSVFAFTGDNDLDENYDSTILSTVLTRIQDSSHYCAVENNTDQRTYKLRFPITDIEMESLNEACKSMNPMSSRAILNTIQNAMEPVEKVYHIEINVPVSFKSEFQEQNKPSLNILTNNMSFNVLGIENVSPRYKINTYINQSEYNELVSLSDDDSITEDVQNFFNVISDITEDFSFKKEREEFVEEITPE
jgi:hypothetical protein